MSLEGPAPGPLDLAALEPMPLEAVLRTYLTRQAWFVGDGLDVSIVSKEILWRAPDEAGPALVWALVGSGGRRYQVLLGVGHESLIGGRYGESVPLGTLASGYLAFDALADHQLCLALLEVASDGRQRADLVRHAGDDRSRVTCLVYDDRLILKLFRRLLDDPGPEPDVEVTTALDRVGFNHLPAPVASWQKDGRDLALVQEFLVGGTEGWSLALTSLRELYASAEAASTGPGEPGPALETVAGAGGDFGAEARRLGEMTARMHLALATAFGAEPGQAAEWAERARTGLHALSDRGLPPGGSSVAPAQRALDRLAQVGDVGMAIRPHGDYHLGQVMRTALGWFVLDFEGGPDHPGGGRPGRCSPAWDVIGMLHSFREAATTANRERGPEASESVADLSRAWERRNRAAFLQGYLSTPDVADLLPSRQASFVAVLSAHSVEQAVIEMSAQGGDVRSQELERLLWAGEELTPLRDPG